MQLNPAEISELIKSRIEGLAASADIRNQGTVVSVADGITRIHGLSDVMAGEMLEFPANAKGEATYGLALNLERDSVGAVILGEYEHISEGDTVKCTGRILEVPVGPELIGRVVNALGQPIDGKGPINAKMTDVIEKVAPGVIARKSVDQPVQTGLKSIDSMVPIGRGQRELIIGDRQTGKTAVAIDTIINQKGKDLICIYVAIGQKASTIANVVRNISVVDSIRPLIQALLPLLASAVSAILLYGLANALKVLFVMAVVWPILLWIVKQLFAPGLDRLPNSGRLTAIVLIFGLTVSPAAYLASVYPTTGSGAFVPPSIFLYALMIGLATAFWSAYEKEINRVYQARNSYLQQIRWKVAEVNSRSWHQQLHFARRVHGSLQSEVAAMAIRLDKMITQASSNPEEIEQLRGRLEERVRLVFEAPDKFTNLADVLTEIAETWEGICQVTVQLADGDAADIARDQIAVETVLEICREGISNAIRHGHAKNVTVAVSLEEVGLVNVRVANDGTPPVQPESSDGSAPGSAREGMGSKHLQECTVSYSVAVVDGQTVLEAAVPYRF